MRLDRACSTDHWPVARPVEAGSCKRSWPNTGRVGSAADPAGMVRYGRWLKLGPASETAGHVHHWRDVRNGQMQCNGCQEQPLDRGAARTLRGRLRTSASESLGHSENWPDFFVEIECFGSVPE